MSEVSASGAVDEGWGPITPTMVDHLRGTRPWVLLLAILGFVGAGFLVLLGLLVGALGALPMDDREFGLAGSIAIACLYLLGALVYVLFSLRLYRYASAIHSFTAGRESRSLEAALAHQRWFWRLMGILSLAYLGLLALVILGAMAFAMLTTAR